MKKEDLYESIAWLEDDLLLRSEMQTAGQPVYRVRKWAAAAACFCLIAVAGIGAAALRQNAGKGAGNPNHFPGQTSAVPGGAQSESEQLAGAQQEEAEAESIQAADAQLEQGTQTADVQAAQDAQAGNWTLAFNTAEGYLAVDRALAKGNLMFTEELTRAESEAVFPDQEGGTGYGTACFDQSGKLLCVSRSMETNGITYDTALYPEGGALDEECYVLPEEPVVSFCNGIEVTAYEYRINDETLLELSFEWSGADVRISARMDTAKADMAKEEINRLLAGYVLAESIDLSQITPNEIPELKDEKLTYAQALEDPDFGAYMLREIPAGFSEETFGRYKDQNSDYLRGLWYQGMREISWKVSRLDASARSRMTAAADTVNYDLALYPIPRAESVPDELREIVDNPVFAIEELTLEIVQKRAYKVNDSGDVDGYRMDFSVCYGDVVVEVYVKGLEPEAVYEMLKSVW